MKHLVPLVFALGFSDAATAAPVTTNFLLEITAGTAVSGGADVSGTQYAGRVEYDDGDMTLQGDGSFTLYTPSLIEIDFLDGIFRPDYLDSPSVTLSAGGDVTGLFFSRDIPNLFFFFANGATFNYEFSELVENTDDPQNPFDEQVTTGRGRGVLVDPTVTPSVPLPASGLLLLAGIGGFAAFRHRKP